MVKLSRTRVPKRAKAPGRPPGRFTQHKRAERLRDLLAAKSAGITIEEVSSALNISVRSARRYMAGLKEAMDLESVGKPGGVHLWRIKPSERGRAITLRRTQAYLLLAARAVFEPLRGSALFDEVDVSLRQIHELAERPLRSPVGGDIQSGKRLAERVVLATPPSRSYAAHGAEIDEVFRAISELRHLAFTLPDKRRVVCHPYALVRRDNSFVCLLRDLEGDVLRAVPIDQMRDTQVVQRHFDLPKDFDAASYVHGVCGVVLAPDMRRALVEFDPRVAQEVRAQRLHPLQKLATARDGRLRLSIPIGDVDLFASYVLGYGDAARVLEPADLVARVRDLLRRTLARY